MNNLKERAVQERFNRLEAMRIIDEQSAREALTYVLVTVSHMNQLSTQAETLPTVGAGVQAEEILPTGGILKSLEEWIDRLVDAMTSIVKKLTDAISFSITVGTNVSVTVNFGPFADAPS